MSFQHQLIGKVETTIIHELFFLNIEDVECVEDICFPFIC